MKALSQSEYGELRSLYESIYTPKETEISEEELTSILEEIALELLDEGYDIEEIEESFDDEFVEEILSEAKVTYGSDTESPEERRARAKAKVGEKKAAARKAAVKSGVEKVKAAPGKALRAAARGTEKAEKEVSRRAGNVAVRAKAGATRAAMKATGVSAMDVPTKSGARKRPDTFVAGRKSDRDAAKAVIKKKVSDKVKAGKAKLAGAATNVAMAGSAAKAAASDAKDRAKKAVSDTKKGIKKGLKGLIRRGAEKVAAKASGVAKRMSEEVDTYDVVVEFLCDYGIAEDLQEAQWLMVNEVDSEDIATILEAYELTETRGTIVSVKGGGKDKYTANRRDLRRDAWNAAVKSSDIRSKKRGKDKANAARAEQARKKSIENMNAKSGEDTQDYGNTEHSGDGHYNLTHSNRAARARRASGR